MRAEQYGMKLDEYDKGTIGKDEIENILWNGYLLDNLQTKQNDLTPGQLDILQRVLDEEMD